MTSPAVNVDADTKRMSRTGQACDLIRAKLVDLTYAPGTTFTEGELVNSLGLTKTPVREALLMLAASGLVVARPGAGYMVMPITLRDIRSLCGHWRRIEGDAAAMTAGLGLSSHSVMHLTDLVKGSGEYADVSLIDRDHDVHWWIVETSGDSYLIRDFDTLSLEILRLYRMTLGESPAGLDEALADLIRAVLAGHPERARTAVHEFVERTERQVIEVLLSSEALMTTNLGLPGAMR